MRRSKRGMDEDGLSVLDVDQKEVRRIINCIKVFGGINRMDEIVKKAAIKKPPDVRPMQFMNQISNYFPRW